MKKILGKFIPAFICIIVLMVPYGTPVLATLLNHTDASANIQSLVVHEGGEESSGTLTGSYSAIYDENMYGYKIGTTNMYKLIAEEDWDYQNAIFCLNAEKAFPGTVSLQYNNVADLKDGTNPNVTALGLTAGNYKSLIWLINNMYLRKQAPEQKDEFLAKAFAEEISENGATVDLIKAYLTDDDIEVVEQWAMWYFTNGDPANPNHASSYDLKYELFAQISIAGFDINTSTFEEYEAISTTRQTYANILYVYLTTEAMSATETEVTYPSINKTQTPVSDVDGDYYKLGPFKVNSGTALQESYNLILTDGTNEIDRGDYEILIAGASSFTTLNIDEIFDQNYYIYLPMSGNSINKVKLILDYSSYETEASLWITASTTYQPLTLITREATLNEEEIEVDIEEKTADLALRKYITKINNTTINRVPTIDKTGLIEGTSETAEYKHAKNPMEVECGDTVVYEIRVYNEGDLPARATSIVDYLPAGLEFVEESTINDVYGWDVSSDGRKVTTNYLASTTIVPFNKTTGALSSAYVQIECKIADGVNVGTILTNVAEIGNDNIDDRDSTPNSININNINTETYKGHASNKTDLGDSNYHYKGLQDDDDFEKVVVKGDVFDLALRKFVTKVNNTALSTSREPVVNVTALKNRSSTNATYTHSKTPVKVEQGDIVIYTIRIYNEGDIAGYAEEVADYLPEGLGFLVNHNVNIDNYWAIPSSVQSVKLSTLTNGKKNLNLSDFSEVSNLNDVDVVVGKPKLVSTKLKSSSTDTANLISAFDRENGTTLSYKDIQIACIVLDNEVNGNNFRNIAEIEKHSDVQRYEQVEDVDSVPGTVNPNNYPGNDANQDDNDYELLTTDPKEFDLALQKFITQVNNQSITNRVPTVTKNTDGTIRYNHTTDPYKVANGDIITYTIRVYNEGDIAGYAKEIWDDIPKGLEFVATDTTNYNYGWKMYDSNGNQTTDISKAVSIRTDYLSKSASEAREDNCLIKPYDPDAQISTTGQNLNPDYKDIKVVFRVVEQGLPSKTNRTIINTAEIFKHEDSNGNDITDRDSTPGNKKLEEDDIDQERVYVKYFDLALKKEVKKAIITEDGNTREVNAGDPKLLKIEVNRNKIGSTTVKFVFNITVENEGEIAGYATEIKDHIPQGLEFIQADNSQWKKLSDNVVTTEALKDKLLQPGEKASVELTLKWVNGENNFGLKTNVAQISKDKNDYNAKDIDSTPDNWTSNRAYEDDEDEASVLLSISTGGPVTYIVLSTTVLAILATGVVLIKKYVLF